MEGTGEEESNILTDNFKKNQQYYEELEITMEDLDELEKKIEEIEEYVGVCPFSGQLDYFVKNDIEKMDAKCIRLEDFMKVIDVKNFIMNSLQTKFEKVKDYLQSEHKFASQVVDIQRRSAMVAENEEYIKQFFKKLKDVQTLEHYLSF